MAIAPDYATIESNCLAIFSNDFCSLEATEEAGLTKQGWGTWAKRVVTGNNDSLEDVTRLVLQTLDQIKLQMEDEKICFFVVPSLGYKFSQPYSLIAQKVLESDFFETDSKVKEKASDVLKTYNYLDFEIRVDRDLTEEQEDSLKQFARNRLLHASQGLWDHERKLSMTESTISNLQEQVSANSIWNSSKAEKEDLDWVLSGSWKEQMTFNS